MQSFDKCGITSQFQLHSVLDHMVKNNTILNDYVDEATLYDDAEDFTDDERYIFDENNEEVTPETIEMNTIETTQPSASSTNSSSSFDRVTLWDSLISVYQGYVPTTSSLTNHNDLTSIYGVPG
ncbi:hypothetical protein BpHYR1_042869 [Brachionus plicatilis]|uniref:Uncharacterized protein n=1 Tax=Brachionus plicatilis TaxID=10195 RepID=A0A3M7SEZ5_BRAPC|nr:hypothetical protein BpHYR1_042869 [Brachionus plicatilis]